MARVSIVGFGRGRVCLFSRKTDRLADLKDLARLAARFSPDMLPPILRIQKAEAAVEVMRLSDSRVEGFKETALELSQGAGLKPAVFHGPCCRRPQPPLMQVRVVRWLSRVGGVVLAGLHRVIAPMANVVG